MHFGKKIEAGTKAEVVFCEMEFEPDKFFWKNGFCLVPSLFPALHNIGVHLGWDLRKSVKQEVVVFNPNINIKHLRDQTIPEYKVNVETSLLMMHGSRISGNIWTWFWVDWKNGDPELIYQRIGFRMILIPLLYGLIGNTWNSWFPSKKDANTVTVSIAFDDGTINKKFPPKEVFEEVVGEKYTETNDGLRYLHYQKTPNGKPPMVIVTPPLCPTIPAGKKIYIASKTAPKLVVNMKLYVHYFPKEEFASFSNKSFSFLLHMWNNKLQGLGIESKPWKHTALHWHEIDTEHYAIVAKALDKEDIPSNRAGGFVCF
jgi:hypothetical protein